MRELKGSGAFAAQDVMGWLASYKAPDVVASVEELLLRDDGAVVVPGEEEEAVWQQHAVEVMKQSSWIEQCNDKMCEVMLDVSEQGVAVEGVPAHMAAWLEEGLLRCHALLVRFADPQLVYVCDLRSNDEQPPKSFR
jgi:hypothetical protein